MGRRKTTPVTTERADPDGRQVARPDGHVGRRRAGLRSSDQVEDLLVRSILDGSYPPGASLPGERELAAKLGVSRPTLREAL